MTRRPNHRSDRRPARRAFSLQEVMIAVGILGIGLILVAGVFPVALSQHRDNVEAAAGQTLAREVQALLETKIDRTGTDPLRSLWRPVSNGALNTSIEIAAGLPAGSLNGTPAPDSPWMLLPTPNLVPNGAWRSPISTTAAYAPPISNWYANLLSNPLLANPAVFPACDNLALFDANDMLSDLRDPENDARAEETPFRLTWYGFYRQRSGGEIDFAVAICRHTRGDRYHQQDLTPDADGGLAFRAPAIAASAPWRLPLPWRVSVRRDVVFGARVLVNDVGVPLASLAPVGSRIMLTGWVSWPTAPPSTPPVVPGGRILKVVRAQDRFVEVLEDISALPFDNPPNPLHTFDVWVFPPEALGTGFANKSPLVEWFLR